MTFTFCPDCGKDIPSDLFIAHRENEHPPALLQLTAVGIESHERVGYQPPDPED